jgi:hypothetical protein
VQVGSHGQKVMLKGLGVLHAYVSDAVTVRCMGKEVVLTCQYKSG